MARFVVLASALLVVAACSGAAPAASPTASPASAPSLTPTASAASAPSVTATTPVPSTVASVAPSPSIAAFTSQTSTVFKLKLMIPKVPSTWSVEDDTPGTFIFDTGSPSTAPNGSTSAVYILNHGMIAPAGCDHPVDKHQNAQQMMAGLVALPGLVSTKPAAISIGGRHGFVTEVHVAPTWNKPCQRTGNGVELLHSLPPTSDPPFDSGISIGTSTAMYLLDRPQGGVMTIQIDDQTGGKDLGSYRSVVETMQLQP
jgi:hypothetical protein